MDKKYISYVMLIIITALGACLASCGGDDDDPNSNKQDEATTIVGEWTYEDYRTGEYKTFEFKANGEYTILEPEYGSMEMSRGRYKYNSKTQDLYFEHFYSYYDFEEHSDDPNFFESLSVKCIIHGNNLTMIGDDCEEFGFTNPVELKKGAYSGDCPDFKSLLCRMGEYKTEEYYSHIDWTEETEFHFYTSGKVEFKYSISFIRNDGSLGSGIVRASGIFSVDNYLLNCSFSKVSKEQTNFGNSSDSTWERFTDGKPADVTFYLALDEKDQVVISDYRFYK